MSYKDSHGGQVITDIQDLVAHTWDAYLENDTMLFVYDILIWVHVLLSFRGILV